jgi:hypothetical protein
MSEKVTLSAVDFLNLAEQRRVARIDLADVGYSGIVYACDLSTAKQQKIAIGPKGKTRVYADKSMDVDLASMPKDAPLKMMIECLVTDAENGRLLEAAFADLPEDGEPYIVWPESELTRLYDVLRGDGLKHSEVEEKLGRMANAVTNLIVKTVREISGTAEDAAEQEKKD